MKDESQVVLVASFVEVASTSVLAAKLYVADGPKLVAAGKGAVG